MSQFRSNSNPHSHSHSHSHSPAFETSGRIIKRAWIYNAFVSRIFKRSESTILKLAGVKPGTSLLDVACGPGSLTLAAKKLAFTNSDVYGVDASVQMIKVARRQAEKAQLKVNFEVGLAENLPFEDGKFDVVISRLAFHHLPGELKTKATAEIYRVLKPGGVCLIVDFDPDTLVGPGFLRMHLKLRHDMMKVDVKEYIPLLEANNFTRIECAPTGHRMLSYVKGYKSDITPGK